MSSALGLRSIALRLTLLGTASALLVAGCRETEPTHEAAGAIEPANVAITQWTDSTEIFLEHPALVAGTDAKFLVHLTRLSDFSPVSEGRLTLSFEPEAGGAAVRVPQQAPTRPGVYTPTVSLPAAGRWDLVLEIDTASGRDEIRVPGVVVHASAGDAPAEEEEGRERIAFLKEQQWETPGFGTEIIEIGAVAGTFEASGEIEPAAGRYAEVAAPIAGLVDTEGALDAPVPGEAVERGQVLAVLTPRLGESGSAFANARRELREAEQEVARARRLLKVEAIPERRLTEAKIRLDAAGEALAGLAGGADLAPDGKLAVRAPIAGVVASRSLAPGASVAAGAQFFTLIDAAVVWLRVHVPAAKAPLLSPESGASFQIEGHPRLYQAGRTLSVGSIVDPRSRTVPVLYEVENPDGSIKVGAHARVSVHTAGEERGPSIPDSAIVEEDGQPVAYVQVAGEAFERRELLLGARDGQRAVVLDGLALGERVVTGGAYRVRLASLSTAVPTHEH